MTLIYFDRDPEPHELAFADAIEGAVEHRTARLWRGETERADAVYANSEAIREAYTRKGIQAFPIAKREPSKTVPAKAKPATRKRRTKAK